MNQLCDPALIPVTEWPEFLDDAEAAALLDFAIAHEKDFKPARTHKGEDPDTRKSLVTLDLGPFKEILKDRVKAALPELAARLKIRGVTGDKFEIELAAHGEGAFFRNHIDTQTEFSEWKDMRSARAISAAYYLNRTPAHFSGGALRLLRLTKPSEYYEVEPRHNLLVAFPSFVRHEVRKVHCPSRLFADSRFAANIWVHHPK